MSFYGGYLLQESKKFIYLQMMNKRDVLIIVFILSPVLLLAQDFSFNELCRQGDSLRNIGQYSKALACYDKAESLAGNQFASRRVNYYQHKADCLKKLGEFDKALQCYDIIEGLDKRMSQREDFVLNKSDVLLQTGRFNRAVSILEPLNCSLEKGAAKRLINLASAYESLNHQDKALALLDSVKRTHQEEKDVLYQIATNNRGYVLWSMGEYHEAAKELEEAISLLDPSSQNYYQTLGNLALVESELQQGDKALNDIDRCIDWFRANYGEGHPEMVVCLRKRAEIILKTQGKTAALEPFKQYFVATKKNIIDNFAYMSTQERQNYWAMISPLIAECYCLEDADPTFLYDVAVFSKSVLLLANRDFLHSKSTDTESTKLFEQIQQLRQQANNSIGSQRTQYEESAEKLERRLMANSNIYRQYQKDLDVDCSRIRSVLKKKNDVAIEFVRYEKAGDTYYAAIILLQKGKVLFVPLFSQIEIEEFQIQNKPLKFYIQASTLKNKCILYEDKDLANKIWGPILNDLPKDANIYFSSEGILNILAIEYLNIGQHNHHFYRLSSTGSLLEKPHKNLLDKVLVIGGVDYDDLSNAKSFESPYPDRSGSILLFEEQDIRTNRIFPYLYGSKKEADGIATILANCDFVIDSLSHIPEERIKSEMGRFSTVHISTHGYSWLYGNTIPPHAVDSIYEDKSLSRCFIALSGANSASKQNAENITLEDGLLTSKELCDMDLSNVGLVVLAACQTGLGRTTDDGLVGLPLGLKKAGVGTVIVSLWKVSDEATLVLMEHFFDNLKSGKYTSVAAAFNKAREQLRSYNTTYETTKTSFHSGSMSNRSKKTTVEKTFDNPYFYDPFIVIDGF